MSKSLRPYPTALLNPCADPTFKILFTSSNKDSINALTEFLCAVIGKKVTDVSLQPNELSGESSDDKQAEFDITCKIDGEYANIEIQGQNQYLSYGKRAEYHVAHLLNHYTPKGMDWADLPKVYQISVLNFVFDKENKSAVNYYKFQNEKMRTVGECMNIIFIELPKIASLPDDLETLTETELWGKFFIYAPRKDKQDFVKQICKKIRGIKMADNVLSFISEDEANWIRETRYWTHVSDTISARNAAIRTGKAEGMEMGKKEGLKQGLQQGIQQGIQEGIQQGKKETQLQIAKNLLSLNSLPIEQIAEITNIPITELKKMLIQHPPKA